MALGGEAWRRHWDTGGMAWHPQEVGCRKDCRALLPSWCPSVPTWLRLPPPSQLVSSFLCHRMKAGRGIHTSSTLYPKTCPFHGHHCPYYRLCGAQCCLVTQPLRGGTQHCSLGRGQEDRREHPEVKAHLTPPSLQAPTSCTGPEREPNTLKTLLTFPPFCTIKLSL